MPNLVLKIFFLIKFFFFETKNLYRIILIKLNNISKFKSIDYISYLFKSSNLKYKDQNITTFLKNIKLNYYRSNRKNSKKKVLVELLYIHPERTIMNCLISKDLQKFYGFDITALIKKNDHLSKSIAQSFGINRFIYYEEGNIIDRIKSLLMAIDLINFDEIDEKLVKLRLFGFEIGKTAYENYLRFYNFNYSRKNKFLLYICLSKSLLATKFAKKTFREKYEMYVAGELQYIPYKPLFHCALKNKISVYSLRGNANSNYIGRLYKNYKDRNSHQLKFSSKLSSLLSKILKNNKDVRLFDYKKRGNNIGKDKIWASQRNFDHLKFKNKSEFNKYFDLNDKNKTVLLLPHAMADNLYNNEWNIFQNHINWFLETLNQIQKINNVNWIIKSHPSENEFKGIKAKQIFNDLNINKKNIVLLDDNAYVNKLTNYIDVVITGNGSPGFQFPAFGVPSITTSDSKYTNFKISYAPKRKQDYFKLLNNINSIKRPTKKQIASARIFWLSYSVLSNAHDLLPKRYHIHNYKEKIFFKLLARKRMRYQKNNFTDDLHTQLKQNNRHSINSSFYYKFKNKFNFKLNDA
jgi:hypothetical protein